MQLKDLLVFCNRKYWLGDDEEGVLCGDMIVNLSGEGWLLFSVKFVDVDVDGIDSELFKYVWVWEI